MMNGNNADLEADDIHDQLPSIEDYKTQIGYRKSVSGTGGGGSQDGSSKGILPRPDPTGSSDGMSLTIAEEFDDSRRHQDPSVDPSAYNKAASGGHVWKYLVCSIIGIAIALTLGITIGKKNAKKGSSADSEWIKDSQRYREIVDYMVQTGVTKTNPFYDETSPQYYAAQWLAHKDKARLSIPKAATGSQHSTFVERYVMAVLYYSLGGPQWTHQLNFLSENHICTWYEDFDVINDPFDMLAGDFISLGIHACKLVGDDLVPYSIYLPSNNLEGVIPEEMHVLDNLEVITLQFNSGITGNIPSAFSKMDNLRHLALQWCDLTGTIPSWIGNAKNLQYLGLGNNRLTGSVPAEIGGLTALQVLGLDDNTLEANIELFSQLSNLKSLYLEDNHISGTITDALLASWPVLQELDLSKNDLSGELPSTFFNHKNELKVVDLHGNSFEGMIPGEIRENNKLEFLALHDNSFSGKIPDSILQLKALRHLDLNSNDLSSTIPELLGQMTNLEYLFLGGNNFNAGEMPRFLIELTNLRELSLKGCSLEGPIPNYLEYLSNLEFLDFHFNSLTGTIPSIIGNLSNLQHLLLKNNQLTGTIPSEMGRLTQLDVLLLEQNDFVGGTDDLCKSIDFVHLAADCGSGFDCSCCNVCCDAQDQTCNAGEWDGGYDPIWEYGYKRGRYSYDMGPHTVVIPP